MARSRKKSHAMCGAALALGLALAAPAAAVAETPERPGVQPAHAVLFPYCEEAQFPFFGPVIICHTWFGDLTFSRPW
ncbi:hypothetical protein [Hoyosella altamirensis]|uniref:Uncharacterized protein n=1 Tax=Hoyosella altamirensis TaxID=616997 RepID=A0A839RIY0_9ACTN|nr:hypothetical protein [Hoyosella altamirensis]MBB3036782.1 hypothetical protein [Hoyosella altamirensis]